MEPRDIVPFGRGRGGRGRGFRVLTVGGPRHEAVDYMQQPQQMSSEGIASLVPGTEEASTSRVLSSELSSANATASTEQEQAPKLEYIGTNGERCHCFTNFVKLKRTEIIPVYQYHVSFVPVLESTQVKKQMVKQLENVIGHISTFDGHALYLPKKLPNEVSVVNCKHPNCDSAEVTATIKFIKDKDNAEEIAQFYNTLIQRILLNHGYLEIRRGFYKTSEVRDLSRNKLQVWPGIALTVEMKDDGLMVMFDTPSRVLRMETLYDFYQQMRDGNNMEKFKEDFAAFVIGKIVLCKYSNQCYKIDDIAWELNPMCYFDYRSTQITYAEYFKRQYNITIRDMEQVLVVSKIKPRNVRHPCPPTEAARVVALVPELCHLTGLTSDQRSNHKLMTEISAITRLDPRLRISAMGELVKEITPQMLVFAESPTSQEILANWGLKFDTEIVSAIGRKIGSPNIAFDAMGEAKPVLPNFSRDACRSCFQPVAVTHFLLFCVRKDLDCARNFITDYAEACSRIGIRLRTNGEIVVVDSNKEKLNPSLFAKALEDSCKKCPDVQFVVVIMPFYREDIYRAVKKYCLTINPIPSQCVMSKTLRHRSIKSVTMNICLQINCKLGGSLWGLKMPIMKKVMVIGMDAAHDPTLKNPSVIALVATLNDTCTSYFSRCSYQPIHQEVCTSLRIIFKDALDAYRQHNGDLPDRILFFRDGGSAGTFEVLKKYEVDICLEVLEENFAVTNKSINFSYICVAKRIPQRIFLKTEGKNIKNPAPGTVLDHSITEPSRYDFYIVSQQISQGTVNPTHYSVLFETKRTKPDVMQKISYALTFMYFNWQGTIKVPSVIQYSHKLGQLVSRIQAMPNRSLSNNLYFL